MKTIDNLLEKYWAGETSLAEETQLREYFSGATVSEQHRPFAAVFDYQNEINNATLPDGFEAALLAEIKDRPNTALLRSIRPRHRWLAVAAAVLFLLSASVFFLKKPVPSNNLADTCLPDRQVPHLIINGKIYYPTTEEEAYQLTKQALLLVSSKMTKQPKATIKSLKKIENVSPGSWGK